MTGTSTLLTVLRAAGRVGVTACLWGDPGIGKSSLIAALAAADGMLFEPVIGSLREPSDFAGLPVGGEDGVRMEPPAWARLLAAADSGYLLLDELSTASPMVQAAMLGVVLDRRVGDLQLPATVRVYVAANAPDRAADGYDLAPPLANRLLHIDHQPTVDAWVAGMLTGFTAPAIGTVAVPDAARTGIARAEMAAFIRARPDLLHQYPDTATATGRAWPSRRTWTMTADLLAVLPEQDTDAALLAATGLVGEGPATEYLVWRREADLPDPADVLTDPARIRWATLPEDRVWAVLAGVVGYCTGRGTIASWRDAWGPLAAAADGGRGDVAAACARRLLTARPANARPPREVRRFATVLTDAGLLDGAA